MKIFNIVTFFITLNLNLNTSQMVITLRKSLRLLILQHTEGSDPVLSLITDHPKGRKGPYLEVSGLDGTFFRSIVTVVRPLYYSLLMYVCVCLTLWVLRDQHLMSSRYLRTVLVDEKVFGCNRFHSITHAFK